MHRVFPFGSRKTWSLNVLPRLVQSNGVVGLATGRRWCSFLRKKSKITSAVSLRRCMSPQLVDAVEKDFGGLSEQH